MDNKLLGRVQWFDVKKGYGFIRLIQGESQGDDIFTHYTSIVCENNFKKLFPGEFVSFSIEVDEKGEKISTNVTGVNGFPLLIDNEDYNFKLVRKRNNESLVDEDVLNQENNDTNVGD